MLRHEASATNETDASCLSITEANKKIEANWREETLIVLPQQLSKIFKLIKQKRSRK